MPYSNIPFEGTLETQTEDATFSGGTLLTIKYQQAGSTTVTGQEIIPAPPLKLKLLANLAQTIVPGTVRFKVATTVYTDLDGRGLLYLENNALAGTVDYEKGVATITTYSGGDNATVVISSLVTVAKGWFAIRADFKTPGSPVQPTGLFISATALDGTPITATADLSGNIIDNQILGTINYNDGIVSVGFGENVLDSLLTTEEKTEWWYDAGNIDGGYIFKPKPVYPHTIKFNAVIYSYLPLSKELIGLDLLRLPSNGKVPKFRSGDIVVIHEAFEHIMPAPLSGGQIENLPHDFIGQNTVYLMDALGVTIPAIGFYVVNEDNGEVEMDLALDLTGYVEPLTAHYRIEDMQLCSGVQINGELSINAPLARDFSTNAFVSTAIIFGDLFSKVEYFFTQKTWSNEWSDIRIGSDSTAKYNLLQYPIFVQNKNAIKERWALVFTSSTTFNIIGEDVGVIGTGTITVDTAPINPQTSEPYWILYAAGQGGGWASGNVIRFNTLASSAPVWVFRTMESGATILDEDDFGVQVRGDCST